MDDCSEKDLEEFKKLSDESGEVRAVWNGLVINRFMHRLAERNLSCWCRIPNYQRSLRMSTNRVIIIGEKKLILPSGYVEIKHA